MVYVHFIRSSKIAYILYPKGKTGSSGLFKKLFFPEHKEEMAFF